MVLAVTPETGTWTATAGAVWLHLDAANQSGTGSTNVIFSYDANPGATRTGTLTIAGQTLTITQAGSIYVAAPAPVTKLVVGLNTPACVAVDGAGNLYISDADNNAIYKWTAANSTVTTLISSGLILPEGVAVDGAGNVYFADSSYNTTNAIKELAHAFVDSTAKFESAAAGSDVLPVVLPTTANLLAPFTPTSNQPWLTISGITNGVVSFAFTANASASSRTTNITLLGQSIPVTQAAPITPPTLIGAMMLGNNVLQFAFSNNTPGATFTVLSTTNISLPLTNWTVVGPATNTGPGLFQFTTPPTTNDPQRFYRVRSP